MARAVRILLPLTIERLTRPHEARVQRRRLIQLEETLLCRDRRSSPFVGIFEVLVCAVPEIDTQYSSPFRSMICKVLVCGKVCVLRSTPSTPGNQWIDLSQGPHVDL